MLEKIKFDATFNTQIQNFLLHQRLSDNKLHQVYRMYLYIEFIHYIQLYVYLYNFILLYNYFSLS